MTPIVTLHQETHWEIEINLQTVRYHLYSLPCCSSRNVPKYYKENLTAFMTFWTPIYQCFNKRIIPNVIYFIKKLLICTKNFIAECYCVTSLLIRPWIIVVSLSLPELKINRKFCTFTRLSLSLLSIIFPIYDGVWFSCLFLYLY